MFFAALFIGRDPIDPVSVVKILTSGVLEWTGGAIATVTGIKISLFWCIPHTWPAAMDTVVWGVRFPRIVAVVLAGSGLAVSGATYQGVFRNPLVSESILGVSAGASLGAALGILTSQSNIMVELMAFAFGLLAVGATFAISRVYRRNQTLVLVLAGIVVGSLFTAFTSMIKYVADPYSKLPDITFWLMGSFGSVTIASVLPMAPIIIICLLIVISMRWRLNVLSLGDEEAKSLGINVDRSRLIVIICATLMTAAAVCVGGLIGWVGLIVPHMARMVVGPDHKNMIIASIFIGGAYLLAMDTICRSIVSADIPISIVTSILGAPIFLIMLYKSKETWS
jgi:iron complex transport system permease protein